MVGILNYGLGNVRAILNIYRRSKIDAEIVSTPEELRSADRIILPGVGAFDWAMTRLNESGMRDLLDSSVHGEGKPVLGICVGMQILARRSDEGTLPGLGWIDGEVKRFEAGRVNPPLQLPHMGWNDVVPQEENTLFAGLKTPRFYFLHSYFFLTTRPDNVLAVTDYGGRYASAVRHGRIFGVQFHPEKSHEWGIQLLKNFCQV